MQLPRFATPLSGLAVLAVLTLTSCTSATVDEIELPTISLGQGQQPTTTPSESPSENPSTPPKTVSDAYAELEMEDQSGDGFSVEIDEVRLSVGTGLLVITDSQGQVLGSSKVTLNTQPVTVLLTTPIGQSQKTYAQIYLDDGDGEFDLNLDTPILDEDGDLARESFDYEFSDD